MNKLFITLLSASMTSAVICNEAAETDKEKAVEVVAEATVVQKNKCANCPCTTENKATEVTADTDKAAVAVDCPCEAAGKVCPCPSMEAEQN